MLDEQSRMAAPIGDLVSDLFYDGALRVAEAAQQSPEWRAARERSLGAIGPTEHVFVHPVSRDGGWSADARGPVRRESAEAAATAVAAALQSGDWSPKDIIVLTPFRAQRALIRHCMQAHGVPDAVRVSTVHRAQGSEAPVVLFDPADGRQPFLQTEEAQRLINVALSRAQAKVVLYLSAGDLTNRLLAPIVQRQRLARDARDVVPLGRLAAAPEFPRNAVGRRVSAGRVTGEVAGVSPDGRQLWLVNERTGIRQTLDVAFWRQRALEGG
jgi:hypothetical protein